MNYNGTINPEAMTALIEQFRRHAKQCIEHAKPYGTKSRLGAELTMKWDAVAETYDDCANTLERAVQAERERILTLEGQ